MNLDFSAEPLFSWYVIALMASGVLMAAAAALPGSKVTERLLYVALGIGMLGYGVYLGFIFDGGSYEIFFYVFVVPIVVLARAVRALVSGPQRA
ncbi:hypothetical protein [Actinomadura decatromicini]|uniref:Uncharacterized protein n=1 Tax=Actinomadura decatromicini TaxID=2604572 RepID=A0A5D3F718_9ACTN|nr:hypothetical protein [Actinomadura decatromicini]TYK43983.1 hypothetical protein FXF68_35250 [Actinomadura decatromicini]